MTDAVALPRFTKLLRGAPEAAAQLPPYVASTIRMLSACGAAGRQSRKTTPEVARKHKITIATAPVERTARCRSDPIPELLPRRFNVRDRSRSAARDAPSDASGGQPPQRALRRGAVSAHPEASALTLRRSYLA